MSRRYSFRMIENGKCVFKAIVSRGRDGVIRLGRFLSLWRRRGVDAQGEDERSLAASHLRLLLRYLRPMWSKVVLLTVLIVTATSLQILNPLIMRLFVDTVILGSDFIYLSFVIVLLLLVALMFLGTSLLQQFLNIASTYVSTSIGWQATNQLRLDLARHCLMLDMSFHNTHTPGEMIERIDGDVVVIANFFSQFAIRIVGNLLLLVGVLIVLMNEDTRVGMAVLAYVVVALAGLGCLRQIAVRHWRAARQASAVLFGFLEEQLSGREDVCSSGAVAYVLRSLYDLGKMRLSKQFSAATMDSLIGALWSAIHLLGQFVALVFSYSLYQAGMITVGSVFLIIYFSNIVFQPLVQIASEFQNLQQFTASIARIDMLYRIRGKVLDKRPRADLPTGPLSITFDNVVFGYNGEQPVLQDVSFCLQPGSVLGLLGRTGSGKTTLTRLLFRLYDPDEGAIHLGVNGSHLDIREIGLDSLRQRIGLVTQNVQLFRGTVRNNITFFDEQVRDERIVCAIEELGLSEWYKMLPEGLDTELGGEGIDLSAGEAQLLAFARVLLRDPGLVILDEASSRLDPATARFVEGAMDRLLQDRTGIIVAHRLDTVRRSDQIMIVAEGRIQEFGGYEDLAGNPGSYFYRLLQTGLQEVLT